DQCLLATGGVPRRLNVPGSDLENVFHLRSLEDARVIVAAVEQAKSVLVVGAGFIGMEVAASLRERGLEVHLVAPEKVPLVNVFGERVGKRIQRLHEQKGILFHLGTTLKEIVGTKKVQEVVLSDGSRLSVDVVVVGLGILPAIEYLQKTNLVQDGAVPVNERLETRAKGIYAAGDIAVVPDPNTGEGRRIEHWVVAERQGQHAARIMLGHTEPYNEVPFFWTRQHGVSLKYVGFAKQFDQIAYRGDVETGHFLAGYYDNGKLKAAVTIGMSKELFAIEQILKTGRSLSFDRFQDEGVDLFALSQGG
ncbi:MAG: FAD-dependent oxidoreductase, partial [candidate division WOR-3 bacterium]